MTKIKAATKAYRAEKAMKERDSHEGENSRGERRVSGAHINPKPIAP